MLAHDYDRRARVAKTDPLMGYHLEGLFNGTPVTLYHGTTRLFRRFDLTHARDDLVNSYYGKGFFFSPSKRVAESYADANRNIGFHQSIVDDLKSKKPNAGAFLEKLVKEGDGAWDDLPTDPKFQMVGPSGQPQFDITKFQEWVGVDPNTLGDIAAYIIGSKVKPLGSGGGIEELMDMFSGSSGAPRYIYDNLDEVGLNSKVYRPKVYTASVTATNTLLTKSQAQARKARSKGYDCVVYYGSDLVQGVPEVAVFDPKQIRIKKIEVVE